MLIRICCTCRCGRRQFIFISQIYIFFCTCHTSGVLNVYLCFVYITSSLFENIVQSKCVCVSRSATLLVYFWRIFMFLFLSCQANTNLSEVGEDIAICKLLLFLFSSLASCSLILRVTYIQSLFSLSVLWVILTNSPNIVHFLCLILRICMYLKSWGNGKRCLGHMWAYHEDTSIWRELYAPHLHRFSLTEIRVRIIENPREG